MATRKIKVTRFRNTSQGFIGVVKFRPNGDLNSQAVEPGGTVELTDDEIEATARAPRHSKDNPFEEQPFEVRDPESGEVTETGMRALLVVDEEVRTAPTRGSRSPREETGAKPKPRARQAA